METNILIPKTWGEFVVKAATLNTQKGIDYENAYMDALLDGTMDGRTIWAWEAKKKLNRLRSWVKRGELLVKTEGALDSVIDIFNYTLMYELSSRNFPYADLLYDEFVAAYHYYGFTYLANYLTCKSFTGLKLLDTTKEIDRKVYDVLLGYTGGTNRKLNTRGLILCQTEGGTLTID